MVFVHTSPANEPADHATQAAMNTSEGDKWKRSAAL